MWQPSPDKAPPPPPPPRTRPSARPPQPLSHPPVALKPTKGVPAAPVPAAPSDSARDAIADIADLRRRLGQSHAWQRRGRRAPALHMPPLLVACPTIRRGVLAYDLLPPRDPFLLPDGVEAVRALSSFTSDNELRLWLQACGSQRQIVSQQIYRAPWLSTAIFRDYHAAISWWPTC